MNKEELTAMVAEILAGMGREPAVKGADYRNTAPEPHRETPNYRDGDFVPDVTALDLRKLYLVEGAADAEKFKRMKEKGVHTALDTSGFAQWETVAKTMPYTDLYLYDIKHMDNEKHSAVVKVPNEQILANAKLLAENGKKLQIRVPVIPLFNDDEENIRATAEFCKTLGDAVSVVQLLPYHNLGVMKYLRISDEKAVEATPPSDEFMQKIKKIMEEYGLPVTIH